MTTLRDRGQAALVRRMQGSAGVAVTYTRVSGETLTLTAWVGRTVFRRTESTPGPAVVFGERDYLFAAADLVVGGAAATPARGDRIVETVGGVALTFEVVPPDGEPAWRYGDATRTTFRVHTKRVA